jgi:nitrate/nitrite-specific signal transduction histidine kinase
MSVRTSSRRTALRLMLTCTPPLLGLLTPPPAQAQVADQSDAVNKAGRLRMLSQRMSKAWLALGQQVEPSRADKVLADSMALFDRQLVELKAYAPTPEIRATYRKLDAVWGDFKAALVGARPAAAAAPALLALDAQILALAQQGTQQLEAWSGRPLGRLVNIAGRQRMLSQRMAKYQLAQGWKAAADAREQVAQARREFLAALDVLNAAPEANATIRQELLLARQQWVFFDSALAKTGSLRPQEAADVFVSSENILQVMDRITSLFAHLTA